MKFKIETTDKILGQINAIVQNDEHLFRLYLNGPKFKSALDDIVGQLRDKVKYGDEEGSWQEAYATVLAVLNERNIDIYEF